MNSRQAKHTFDMRIHPCEQRSHNPFCLPLDLPNGQCERMPHVVQSSIRVQKGDALFEAGQPAHKLYVVHSGSFKSILGSADGRQQIIGFHLPGEIMGLESLATRTYTTDCVALEDALACEIDLGLLESCARQWPALQHQIHSLIGSRLQNAQLEQFVLGSMHAEERLARFLLDLSARLKTRGESGDAFNLSMSREELGSFLGLKLETVSRLMTRFHEAGLLEVHLRQVRIVDHAGLSRLLQGGADSADARSGTRGD